MSEFPPEQPDWQRREASIEAARHLLDEPYHLGTITVAYDSDETTYGSVWGRATCSECPAELVMRINHSLHLRQLALDTAYVCPKYGHEQSMAALIAESMPDLPEVGE